MKSTSSIILVFAFALFTFMGMAVKVQTVSASGLTQDSVKTEKKEVKKETKEIDKKLANEGKGIFNSKCLACHKLDGKLVGPPLRNITKTLSNEYLTKYLTHTTEMQKSDPRLKKLIKEYNGVLMPDQYLNKKQVAAVIEYLESVKK
ncbi:MAG: c-type cytochrome [Ignavibacteriaceae bacterium]